MRSATWGRRRAGLRGNGGTDAASGSLEKDQLAAVHSPNPAGIGRKNTSPLLAFSSNEAQRGKTYHRLGGAAGVGA